MARHNHASKSSAAVSSGFTGTGGRALPNNGHADIAPSRASIHSRPATAYRVANSDGSGIERHRGHKYSQASYESVQLGW